MTDLLISSLFQGGAVLTGLIALLVNIRRARREAQSKKAEEDERVRREQRDLSDRESRRQTDLERRLSHIEHNLERLDEHVREIRETLRPGPRP